jgi:hypothetical protein
LSARFLKDAFKLETSLFGSVMELVELGLVLIFDLKKNLVGSLPYDCLASFLLPREIFTNFIVFGLDWM